LWLSDEEEEVDQLLRRRFQLAEPVEMLSRIEHALEVLGYAFKKKLDKFFQRRLTAAQDKPPETSLKEAVSSSTSRRLALFNR